MAPHLSAWATNQPIALRFVAREAVTAANVIATMIGWARSGRWASLLPRRPPVQDWLKFYQRSDDVCLGLARTAGVGGAPLELIRGFRHPERVWARLSPDGQQDVIESLRDGSRMQEIAGIFSGEAYDQHLHARLQDTAVFSTEQLEQFKRDFVTPAMQFFFRVTLPCVVLHGTHPSILMHRARRGDAKALDALLRIDQSVMHDWVLAEHAHQLGKAPRSPANRRVYQALNRGPFEKGISDQAVKVKISAFLSQLSRQMSAGWKRVVAEHPDLQAAAPPRPLTTPQLRALFDAAEQDATGGRCDPDLPASPEAFAKAVTREQARQLIVPELDKS